MAYPQKAEVEPGALTPEQEETAQAWLAEVFGDGPTCPMCSNNDWVMGPILSRLYATRALMGGRGYPTLVMVCENCAYTALFNALVIGVDQPDEEDQDDEGGNDG